MKALQKKRINYIKRLAEISPKKSARHKKILTIIPIAVAAAVVVGITGYMHYKIYSDLIPELDSLILYNNDPNVLSEYYSLELLQQEEQAITAIWQNLKTATDNINSYQEFTKARYETIENAAGSTIAINSISFDRTNAGIALICTGPDQNAAADFVRLLRETNEYSYIYYYGYAGDDTIIGGRIFNFQVILNLGTPFVPEEPTEAPETEMNALDMTAALKEALSSEAEGGLNLE